MQYEITLPADYDMQIIRHRVRTRGNFTDAFPGLGLKAYCIREREHDEPVNQYAPFYFWHNMGGMNSFLFGDGFRGLCDSFGRPMVQHWVGAAFVKGLFASKARFATRTTAVIPFDTSPAEPLGAAIDEMERSACHPHMLCSAVAVDPRRWEVVRFTLWEDVPDGTIGTIYEVLHTSSPHLDEIAMERPLYSGLAK